MKKTMFDFDFNNKKVLIRLDLNVPIKDGQVKSDLRIKEALPTLHFLINQNAKIIVLSHLGRPDGEVKKEFSLQPVFETLKFYLPNKVGFCENDIKSEKAKKSINNLKNGNILLMENIRFYKEEEKNDAEFSKYLASLGDIYVMDAFGTAHRKHCSTYGIAEYLPSCMGFLMEKEINAISGVMDKAQKPFVAILGGAKIKDKIKVVENLIDKVDVLLIGGGMSYTFIKALKGRIGNSLLQEEYVDLCFETIKKALDKNVKLLLPLDHICVKQLNATKKEIKVFKNDIPDGYMAVDIGPKTAKLYAKEIKKARTIIWNGPMGIFEQENFDAGTKMVATAVAKNKKAVSVVGGGDTTSALQKWKLQSKISHVSTGGGASLEMFEGKILPGYEIISNK